MILLNANNLEKQFGGETLFSGVGFSVDSRDKIGFVGINGAGKSTLFKLITGELLPDGGEIFRQKGIKTQYLEQHTYSGSEKSVFDEVLEAFSEQTAMEKELEEIRKKIDAGEHSDVLIKRQQVLNERFSESDGYFYKNKVKSALAGLGFSEEEMHRPVNTLSGGQKTRAALCRVLLSGADLLLLDEPTNHLDISSVEWLEDFLCAFRGAVIVISHDRYFLDRVTNKTMGLENGRLYVKDGSYSEYTRQRELEQLTERRAYDNTMREIERLEGVVEQQRRWNREKNIKTAESKLKVIERLEENLQKPEEEDESISFAFRARPGGGDDALCVSGISKGFSVAGLLSGIDFQIQRGERVFLLGPNGCGKTTLIRLIMGELLPDAGEIKIGASTYLGYYDQTQSSLSMDKTVIDELWDEYPKMTQTEIRNALAVFLFRGEDVFKQIRTLSGGERARTELAKLILKDVNFLIMDEPTNHLDIQSKEALERALSDYDGTMLMVSHDRYFINKIADRILYLEDGKIENFPGNYDYFLEKHKAKGTEQRKKTSGGEDYKLQKALEAEKRKTKAAIERLEAEIPSLEEQINAEGERLNNPEIAADYEKAMEITEKIADLSRRLDECYLKWEELQEKNEGLE